MSCNPCCCLKLKDAAITIGIWSTVYGLAQIAVFGWQFSVLAQCQHVTMAQSNLQCDYYCPCVGASTARTSAIIEGLFVIQILCLISAFFLLFASIMMIYGIHTWSRYLLIPWMVTMCASILTSLAYCIMWWAGDVRDYWLMLTIVEMFGVFLNIYCFVVIATFHRRMLAELEYYARRRKYDRFSGQQQQRMAGTPQHTIEQELEDSGEEFGGAQKAMPSPYRRPPAGQFPYHPSPPPQPVPSIQPVGTMPREAAIGGSPRQFYQQRTPMERFQQEAAIPPPPPEAEREFLQRPRSALDRTYQSQYDEFRRRRPSSQRHRHICRHCGRDHGSRHNRCHHCHYHVDHCHCHLAATTRHRKHSCSSICSTANFEAPDAGGGRRRRKERRRKERAGGRWSDQESDLSEFAAGSIQSEHNYGNIGMMERRRRAAAESQRRRGGGREAATSVERRKQQQGGEGGGDGRMPSHPFMPPQGISIPQHIVIPPMAADGTLDSQAERQYRINSEITISYDPQRPDGIQSPSAGDGPPAIPPRRQNGQLAWPKRGGDGQRGGTFPGKSVPSAERRMASQQQQQQQQPLSITSNV